MKLGSIFTVFAAVALGQNDSNLDAASGSRGFVKTGLTKVNKYYNFVEPFLNIYINPKPNGKLMKVKIGKLEDKFEKYKNRFSKYYVRCGIEEEESRKRRRRETKEERKAKRQQRREERRNLVLPAASTPIDADFFAVTDRDSDEEEEYFKEIEDLFTEIIGNDSVVDGRRTRGKKIGNLQDYDVTLENMEMLWQKIVAGFSRNFDRHIRASPSCSKKMISRLDSRLIIAKGKVQNFIRHHRNWA